MKKILNWGFLSTAKINKALIQPLNASKQTMLLAVASRNIHTAQTYAREHQIPRAYGSYEDLLADPEIDVIYNPLPNHLHTEWTLKALHAGKHVLCEKPFALTPAEVDTVMFTSQKTGKIATEAFMYRHHAQTLKVKEIVESGILGKIQLIKGAFTFKLQREGNFRHYKEMGGGSLWDVGCYPVSYARLLAGEEPVEVLGWQVTGAAGSDESFYGQMRFGNGIVAQFDCGFNSPARSYIEVIGTEGVLHVTAPFKPALKNELFLTRDGAVEKIKVKGQALYLGEVEDLCKAIFENKAPLISLLDTRGNITAISALLLSAQTGKVVSI